MTSRMPDCPFMASWLLLFIIIFLQHMELYAFCWISFSRLCDSALSTLLLHIGRSTAVPTLIVLLLNDAYSFHSGWKEMKVSALLTSAGINIGICALLLCLYSILRKQPGNAHVYFGRKLARDNYHSRDPFIYERLVPSIGWILKAWVSTENDIMADAGLDSVVFLRLLVFR